MSRQALEMALEALERSVATCFDQRSHDAVMGRPEHFVNQAITAIKEALAQPEQEPVAWMQNTTAGLYVIDHYDEWHCIPLYTTPPQRKPLTDEEIDKIWVLHSIIQASDRRRQAFARAIEAAHGIKE